MKQILLLACLFGLCFFSPLPVSSSFSSSISSSPSFRPSATPLFSLSPTTAVWLRDDQLAAVPATHWIPSFTMSMTGYTRIDGVIYRFLGVDQTPVSATSPQLIQTNRMNQTSLQVRNTQTIFTFQAAGVELKLTFTTPAFPDDLSTSSRPISYLTASFSSVDQKQHTVQLYVDQASDWPLNDVKERIMFQDESDQYVNLMSHTHVLSMWGYDNVEFDVKGDLVKPNWSHLYFATNSHFFTESSQHDASLCRTAFVSGQALPSPDTNKPRLIGTDFPVSAFTFDLGLISNSSATPTQVVIMFAVDDVYTMRWFGTNQEPLWRHNYGGSVVAMITDGLQDYTTLKQRAEVYDQTVWDQLATVAGTQYAQLAALAHRQVMGATTSVWNEEKKQAWMYMKEQSSDGDVSTVDVIFPASPFYLFLGPEQLRLMLLPLLSYANNETEVDYNLAWAPHHLGVWPVCDLLPQEQEQMPMEESSSMLIMLAAIAQRQGGAVDYLEPYLPLLDTWAEFLQSTLPDPGNQLCTDDFEGPSPHNANLAVHGITGISAYAILLDFLGLNQKAKQWNNIASSLVADWELLAIDADQSHFKQRFDQNGTWSEKYNLVWQYVLGGEAEVFSQHDLDLDMNFYYRQQRQYGIPLDNRHPLSKCDSSSWIAAMTTNADQRDQMINWLYEFVNTTPDRQPFPDVYDTTTNRADGFFARPVMGGLYNVAILGQKRNSTVAASPSSLHQPAKFLFNSGGVVEK